MPSNKIYDIDFKKLAGLLIPVILRKNKFVALVRALVTPIDTLYKSFIRFRADTLYSLSITPQVCYLEKMLNDRYDTVERRIYIKDAKEYPPLYLYLKSEGVAKAKYVYRKSEGVAKAKYLYTKGEAGINTFDFIVYVPGAVQYNVNEMVALINSYKLASKKYKIQNV